MNGRRCTSTWRSSTSGLDRASTHRFRAFVGSNLFAGCPLFFHLFSLSSLRISIGFALMVESVLAAVARAKAQMAPGSCS